MEKDTDITRVVFRVDKAGDFKGTVTALFPDDLYNEELYGRERVTCYAHIGQHGSADWSWVTSKTRPATEAEYKELYQELESLGYNLKVCKRR